MRVISSEYRCVTLVLLLPLLLTADPVKIMPLGDSRTAGPSARNCYRLYLDRLMTAAGYSFDFVGTQKGHAELLPSVIDGPTHQRGTDPPDRFLEYCFFF